MRLRNPFWKCLHGTGGFVIHERGDVFLKVLCFKLKDFFFTLLLSSSSARKNFVLIFFFSDSGN